MTKEEMYQQHKEEMFGTNQIDEYSDEEIERVLGRILLFLPNNSKLYKYRPIEGEGFNHAFDSLEKGYLWMAKACTLNDDLDSILNYDVEREIGLMKKQWEEVPWKYFYNWVKFNANQLIVNTAALPSIEILLRSIDRTTWQLNKSLAIKELAKLGGDFRKARGYIEEMSEFIRQQINESVKRLESGNSGINNFNSDLRSGLYIFSLSEEYDCNTMWAYYANNNKGFCIEYDFAKVKKLDMSVKRKLISIYKVRYVKELEKYSFELYNKFFSCDKEDYALLKNANYDIVNKMITKESKWEHEKEWRLVLCYLDDQKLYADIVSALIIDQRIIESENANKLISLAKERKWEVRIRKTNKTGTQHLYENYVY